MAGELPFDAWRREQGYPTPAGRELAQYDARFDAWIVAATELTFEEWIEYLRGRGPADPNRLIER